MALDPYPDVMKALLDRARAHAGVTSLTAGRVAGELQEEWAMPTQAIVLIQAGGAADDDADLLEVTFQADCFGAQGHLAAQVAGQLDAALRPLDRHQSRGFTLAHTVVHTVSLVEGPVNVPMGRWPRRVLRYRAIYGRRYVP